MTGIKGRLALVPLLIVAAVAQADEARIAAGAELYAEFCETCHGENKTGIPEYTEDLETFTEMLNGETEEMPDFTDFFEDDEISAMHAYLAASEELSE